MPAPIIWGALALGGGLVTWWGTRATNRVVDDIDTLGDVTIGAVTGVSVGYVTKQPLLGVAAGLGAYVLARGRGGGS